MFIVVLAFLGWVNGRPAAVIIPAESAAMAAELVKSFSGTAIPEYVFTYGTSLSYRHSIDYED